MSWFPGTAPEQDVRECPDAVEMIIVPRSADVGNLEVRRVLPFRNKRMVGPFIFWDEMGPGEFLTNEGLDVLPHPHIGLSTVTFLESGSLQHRDSVGSNQIIEPGDVNLMRAGNGIAHSERTPQTVRGGPSRLAGIQSWLAAPKDAEDSEPGFSHTPKAALPVIEEAGARVRVLLGEAFGETSPVPLDWPTIYLDVRLDVGSSVPLPTEIEERAVYVLSGQLSIAGTDCPAHQMLVLKPGYAATATATTPCRFMVLGGAVLDGPRYIWWNFVASSRERIEHAKEQWQERRFPIVTGDTEEFVPLPE